MYFFCSQYLYLSMLALWSGLHHCNQIWMPHHICFKHCTKVYSEAFASKRAHPCSELSKTCMSLAQSSRDWEELSCGLESLWTQAGPAHVFVQKEGACASPKHLEPDASSESKQRGTTATGHADMLPRSLSCAKFREHSTQALPLNWTSRE